MFLLPCLSVSIISTACVILSVSHGWIQISFSPQTLINISFCFQALMRNTFSFVNPELFIILLWFSLYFSLYKFMKVSFCLFGLYFTIALQFAEYRQMMMPMNAGNLCPCRVNLTWMFPISCLTVTVTGATYIAPCHFTKAWKDEFRPEFTLCRPNDQQRVARDCVTFRQLLLRLSGFIVVFFSSFVFLTSQS